MSKMNIEEAIKICNVFIKPVRSDIEEDAEDNFETIEAIETVLEDREILELNYITLIENVTKIGKQLGLEEDCTIDEIIVKIWAIQRENEQLKTVLNSSINKDKIKEY